jgi:mRNA-degrading endonuclease YafQ of YafQ-DinJ toxin-antitoxin module
MIPTNWHTRRHIYALKQINNALKPESGSPFEAMLKDALAGEIGHRIDKDMQEDLLLLYEAQQNVEAAIIALECYLKRCI